MRKLITLGLFALLISLFTSQVFASNVDACDEVKHNKVLHGLCVAWHNANEKNKDKFADRYFDLTGEKVPGSSDFGCPCFSNISFSQVCSLGSPSQAPFFLPLENPIFGVVIFDGGDEFFGVTRELDENGETTFGGCVYDGQFLMDPLYPELIDDLTSDEANLCMAELLVIAVMNTDEELCPSSP